MRPHRRHSLAKPKPIKEMIKRNIKEIPKPSVNPAGSLIEDTLESHGVNQKRAAEAMAVSPQLLNNVIKRNQAVSVDLAMRFEICFKIPATQLLRLQAVYEYQIAYHKKQARLEKEVKEIA